MKQEASCNFARQSSSKESGKNIYIVLLIVLLLI
jgi:hypothetical protein